jgi:hypothetical protein
MQGWAAVQETATGGFALVNGPSTPPMGNGSASFVVDSTGGMAFGTQQYLGTPLSQITTLSYSTYRASGGAALAVSLQFNIDPDLTDGSTGWFGRLVFEPYYTETVQTGTWQTWNAMVQGKWWFTGAPGNTTCSIGSPCTWAGVLGAFPNIGIHATLGAVILKAGGGWTGGFTGNADALTIGVLGSNTTYNFELGPTNKDECKNGGWQGFFRNQGQCVSYFVSNRP